MTEQESKIFARKKILKGTGIIVLFWIILLLLGETKGDFANGILFFLDEILSIHTIVTIVLIFGLSYYLAGIAGKHVINEKQNILIVSLRNAIILSFTISIYVVLIGVLHENDFSVHGFKKIFTTYFLDQFLKSSISFLLVWLWATSRMKSIKV